MKSYQKIASQFPAICQSNFPLSNCCTWHIGGKAAVLAQPRSVSELRGLLVQIRELNCAWWLIGNGSNLLFPDEGLAGIVIRLAGKFCEFNKAGNILTSGAAAPTGSLARYAARSGLGGLEFMVGIPALLGGALRMNAGAHGSEISDCVRRVQLLNEDNEVQWFDVEDLGFSYRQCDKLKNSIALFAELQLESTDSATVRERIQKCQRYRQDTQPLSQWTCGSVFKRPGEGLYPGQLIEEAGLKGTRIGAIEVSQKHANFFVNTGAGLSRDVLSLVEYVRREVQNKSGIELREEFRRMEQECRH